MAYPGTISITPETLTRVLYEVLRSLTCHGFKRLIVINGHRSANLPPLQIAATRVRNETGAYVTIADPFFLGTLPQGRSRNPRRAGSAMPKSSRLLT